MLRLVQASWNTLQVSSSLAFSGIVIRGRKGPNLALRWVELLTHFIAREYSSTSLWRGGRGGFERSMGLSLMADAESNDMPGNEIIINSSDTAQNKSWMR